MRNRFVTGSTWYCRESNCNQFFTTHTDRNDHENNDHKEDK